MLYSANMVDRTKRIFLLGDPMLGEMCQDTNFCNRTEDGTAAFTVKMQPNFSTPSNWTHFNMHLLNGATQIKVYHLSQIKSHIFVMEKELFLGLSSSNYWYPHNVIWCPLSERKGFSIIVVSGPILHLLSTIFVIFERRRKRLFIRDIKKLRWNFLGECFGLSRFPYTSKQVRFSVVCTQHMIFFQMVDWIKEISVVVAVILLVIEVPSSG